MRQFHARAHFARVELIDARRRKMVDDFREKYVGDPFRNDAQIPPVDASPRYRRLCRIDAMYRIAGFLSPQEI